MEATDTALGLAFALGDTVALEALTATLEAIDAALEATEAALALALVVAIGATLGDELTAALEEGPAFEVPLDVAA